jgi:hypothetical protein
MIRSIAALAMSSIALSASAQDLTIVFKSSDGSTATHYFTKDKARMNNGRSDSLLEFSTGRIVSIDNQKKEYSEVTIAEMEETMKAASAQMEEQLAKMPPQMRDRMAKMMGGGLADVTISKGGTKTIAGYSCQSYTIAMGENLTQETCNSTAITPPFDPANFAKMARISVPMMRGAEKMAEKFREIQGMSLQQHTTMNMMGQKRDISMEATEVKKGAIAADVFAIPAGYKKVDSPLKNLGKMGGPR